MSDRADIQHERQHDSVGRPASIGARLLRDRSGLSGMEFAIILPIIVVLFAATLDLGQALMVNRRINQIATMTTDILTQETSWTEEKLDTLLAGAASILNPFLTNPVKVQVSVLDINNAGVATVNWSYGYNTEALAKGARSPVDIPTNISEAGVQIALTEVEFGMTTVFTSLLSNVTGLDSYRLTSSAFARPRVGNKISLN